MLGTKEEKLKLGQWYQTVLMALMTFRRRFPNNEGEEKKFEIRAN